MSDDWMAQLCRRLHGLLTRRLAARPPKTLIAGRTSRGTEPAE